MRLVVKMLLFKLETTRGMPMGMSCNYKHSNTTGWVESLKNVVSQKKSWTFQTRSSSGV